MTGPRLITRRNLAGCRRSLLLASVVSLLLLSLEPQRSVRAWTTTLPMSRLLPSRVPSVPQSHSGKEYVHRKHTVLQTPPLGTTANNNDIDDNNNKLDNVLSTLTSAFPFFVVMAAVLGANRPALLSWVNRGELISIMLASVMCGTGLTLEKKDFTNILQSAKPQAIANDNDDDNKDPAAQWIAVPLGVLCQFIIMPMAAALVGRTLLLPAASQEASALFLGLCLVGCSPGGTASNLVSLIANADVALSVLLTTCSTLLAVIATPLLVKLIVGNSVRVSGMALCQGTAKVVLAPVIVGMLLRSKLPRLAIALSRFTPFASVLLVSAICGGVVSQNASLLQSSSQALSGGVSMSTLILSVLLLHSLGFALGYVIPKLGFQQSEKSCRTISIEVGMQNSALAVVLARSIGAPSIACLPGALSATAHSCLGSTLAAFWRMLPTKPNTKAEPVEPSIPPPDPNDNGSEFQI